MEGPEIVRLGALALARQADRLRKAAGRANLPPARGPSASVPPPRRLQARGSIGEVLRSPPALPEQLLHPTVAPRWDGPRPPAFALPPELLRPPFGATRKGKAPLPAYLQPWDSGVRPKCAVLPKPRPTKRPAEAELEADSRTVRPRVKVQACWEVEAPPPQPDAAAAEAPSAGTCGHFGGLTGAERRRAKRESDAEMLGVEGLLTTYVQAGQAAFVDAARSSGVLTRLEGRRRRRELPSSEPLVE